MISNSSEHIYTQIFVLKFHSPQKKSSSCALVKKVDSRSGARKIQGKPGQHIMFKLRKCSKTKESGERTQEPATGQINFSIKRNTNVFNYYT